MSDISSIGHGSVGPVNRLASIHSPVESRQDSYAATTNGVHGDDRVELSQHARLLDQLRQLPDVRLDRVEAVRKAITEGAYETPARIEAAIERLLEDLGDF